MDSPGGVRSDETAALHRDVGSAKAFAASAGFPMPGMPAAVWPIVATNPVITRASDRFRLYNAGAEHASQADQ
jgi:hypothetical protein